MNFNSFLISAVFASILFFTSCKDEHEYRVEEEFENYVIRFEEEASKRNLPINLHSQGLIIEFANLKDNQAGLCHYENPIRIEVDKTYWQAISSTQGADLMKENLIFHELGHGILKRDHINTILENGDWKSIMCGGTKVDNRPWNINYRGVRRNYYVDELFKESTSTPDFADTQLRVDTAGYISHTYLSFDSEKKDEAGWQMSDNDNYSLSIDNKRLKFESKIDYSYFILTKTSVNVLSDFSFEAEIQSESTNKSNQYGLIFGLNDATENIEYFSVNNNQKMQTGNRQCYSFFTELTKSSIKPGVNNKLLIIKIGFMLYYFINDVYVYCSEIVIAQSAGYFGFIVPPKATVWLDNMKISVKKNSTIQRNINTKTEFYIRRSATKTLTVFDNN